MANSKPEPEEKHQQARDKMKWVLLQLTEEMNCCPYCERIILTGGNHDLCPQKWYFKKIQHKTSKDFHDCHFRATNDAEGGKLTNIKPTWTREVDYSYYWMDKSGKHWHAIKWKPWKRSNQGKRVKKRCQGSDLLRLLSQEEKNDQHPLPNLEELKHTFNLFKTTAILNDMGITNLFQN